MTEWSLSVEGGAAEEGRDSETMKVGGREAFYAAGIQVPFILRFSTLGFW